MGAEGGKGSERGVGEQRGLEGDAGNSGGEGDDDQERTDSLWGQRMTREGEPTDGAVRAGLGTPPH